MAALRPHACISSPEPLVSFALSRASARVALGHSTGTVQLISYEAAIRDNRTETALLGTVSVHRAPVRAVLYASEDSLCTGAADGELCLWDLATETEVWRVKGHDSAVSRIADRDQSGQPDTRRGHLVSGDDDGVLKLWDIRTRDCVKVLKHHEDYISGLTFGSDNHSDVLLATSGDATLSAVDIRKKGKLLGHSENQEDELLSVAIMKHGKKVVCGTGEGVLHIFSWDRWSDCNDRYPGHPTSVDALCPFDEDTLFTGSSDGLVRYVNILPNKLLGVLGDHKDLPVEGLAMGMGLAQGSDGVGHLGENRILASLSHDDILRLWDLRDFHDDDDDDNEDGPVDETSNRDGNEGEYVGMGEDDETLGEADEEVGGGENGDDDEVDGNGSAADDDEDDDDEDDDEDDGLGVVGRMKKRLKTAAEQFYSDL